MVEPERCASLSDIVADTVVLAMKYESEGGQDVEGRLAKAMKLEEVQSAIRQALEDQAEETVKTTPSTFSSEEANRFANSVLQRGYRAIRQDVLRQVRTSPRFLELRKSAEEVVSILDSSPTGVWYDDSKRLVYVIAAGVIVAGAVVIYVVRPGDAVSQVAQPVAALLTDDTITYKPLGTLELSAGMAKLDPSRIFFKLDLAGAASLKPVRGRFSTAGYAMDSHLKAASGEGKLFIPFGKVVARLDGAAGRFENAHDARNPENAPVQLGLGVSFIDEMLRLDLAGRLQLVDSRQAAVGLDLGLNGNYRGNPYNSGAGARTSRDSVFGLGILKAAF
ncbi:MAG TPA: hypothetical protein VNH22_06180 [Blastocatellia bacterium]|jgi:hypothetical protein|nr:hypothetical protein [Blastocatellia bacterium]